MNYATIEDVNTLFRPLTNAEIPKATALIPVVCDRLRAEALKVGKDLDEMIESDSVLVNVAKSITVDIVARTLLASTNSEPMAQFSESALGYTVSGTPLNAGGGVFIKRDELKALGLRKQKIGVISLNGCY